jgi:hypothetical protein
MVNIIYMIFYNETNLLIYFSEIEPQQEIATASASSKALKRKKRLRKADTNVLSVKFNRLLQPGN